MQHGVTVAGGDEAEQVHATGFDLDLVLVDEVHKVFARYSGEQGELNLGLVVGVVVAGENDVWGVRSSLHVEAREAPILDGEALVLRPVGDCIHRAPCGADDSVDRGDIGVGAGAICHHRDASGRQ